ncbi:MAG: tetratricopeptide repeat protein [Spirulina sp.]
MKKSGGQDNQTTNVPRSGVINFVGQDDKICEISQAFEIANRTVIIGMGGVGKTELAIQYALKFTHKFSSICWIDSREKDIASQVVQYTKVFFDFEKIIPDLDLKGQLEFCWKNWPVERNLIIFDDVKEYESVEDLLPPDRDKFKVLMTSRSSQLGQARTTYIKIELLKEKDSLDLLRSIVGRDFINENIDLAKQICHLLGHLPLGLELIGRYLKSKINKRKPSLLKLKQRLELEGLKAKPTLKASQDMTAQRGLYSAFQLSWEELDRESRYVAFVIGLFALAPIERDLIFSCIPHLDSYILEDIIDESLLDLHLLNYREDDTYQFHQLIREFISSKNTDIQLEEVENCKKRVSNYLAEQSKRIPESITKETISELGNLIPHLIEVTQQLITFVDDQNFFPLYQGLGRYYEGQSFYSRSEEIYLEAKEIAETRFGNANINTIKVGINLAAIYYEQGRYREAENLQRSLLACNDASNSDKLVRAEILNGLGLTLTQQGEYKEAEDVYNLSIRLRTDLLGNKHLDVSDSFNNLGLLHNEKGDYQKAESLFLKSLEIRTNSLGENHVRVGNCLNNLASCYFYQERYEEARSIYLRVLEMYRILYGDEHRELATALNNLSVVYLEERNFSDAETILLEVRTLQEKILGNNHPDIAVTMSNLAAVYLELGKVSQAETTYKQALKIQREILEPDHINIGITLNNLAKLYQSTQRYLEADTMYLDSIRILKKTLDDDHPTLNKVRGNLEELREQIKTIQH